MRVSLFLYRSLIVYSHRITFQVQVGRGTESVAYNEDRPCTKREAKSLLDDLESKVKRWEFKSQANQRRLSDAIEDAKRWIDRSRSMGSYSQSTTITTFETEDGSRCRIDIHIHAGDGHFA